VSVVDTLKQAIRVIEADPDFVEARRQAKQQPNTIDADWIALAKRVNPLVRSLEQLKRQLAKAVMDETP
jgi:hypothetical protein